LHAFPYPLNQGLVKHFAFSHKFVCNFSASFFVMLTDGIFLDFKIYY
jgi:hypothetical protein